VKNVIVTDIPRPDLADLDRLAPYGVATVHEALGRTGFLGPQLRPVQQGARIAGSVVTALCWPGDNLMIHAAVEQCGPGDILLVTTNSPNNDGLFGELFATALQHRGVRGVVTTTGIRDTDELRQMAFPAWSAAVSSQGSVKATAGAVNVPVTVGGVTVRPGDALLADDDGVMSVGRGRIAEALRKSQARLDKEEATRAAFRQGELGLDRYGMRPLLDKLGVRYVTAEEYAREERAERGEDEG
jgi:4-hydroxy-4-methyl-2-oxoglutarate aldolase